MKFVLMIMTLLTTLSSHSYDDYRNRYQFARNTTAKSVCHDIYSNYYRDGFECQRYIKGKKFTKEALKLCSKSKSIGTKMECLKIIADATFDTYALKQCDGLPNSSSVRRCLRNIKNATFNKNELKACRKKGEADIYKYRSIKGFKRDSKDVLVLCLGQTRINKKLESCKSITKNYTKLFLKPSRSTDSYYNLSYDIVKLVDSKVYVGEHGTKYNKVKILTENHIVKSILNREFFILSEDVEFPEQCYK